MLIYNTTYLVNNKKMVAWMKWIEETHIPFMRKTGNFTTPQLAKILFTEDNESTSFSVQFKIKDLDALGVWNELYADELQKEILEIFDKDVLPFSTVLELIEQ